MEHCAMIIAEGPGQPTASEAHHANETRHEIRRHARNVTVRIARSRGVPLVIIWHRKRKPVVLQVINSIFFT